MNKLEKRIKRFDEIVKEIENKGYVMNFQKIALTKINIISLIILLGSGCIFLFIDYLLYGSLNIDFSFQKYFIFLAGVIICLVIHEGIHGLTAMIVGKVSFCDLEFGMMKGNPYCYVCSQLSKQQYLCFSLMPTFILGICMAVIGIVLHHFWLILLAVFNLSGGAGDLCVSYQLITQDCEFVMDHPYEVGFVYFEKKK